MDTRNFNTRDPSVKRILTEIKEFEKNPNPDYYASPLEDNIFEWHFTIRGAPSTPFSSGLYHGTISLPAEYPFKPPHITLSTPNGRFEVNTRICLTISAHHPEHWQPSWSIRTVLVALIAFMETKAEGIGSLECDETVRRRLAKDSVNWKCAVCKKRNDEILVAKSEEELSQEGRKEEEKEKGKEEDKEEGKEKKKEEEEEVKVEVVVVEKRVEEIRNEVVRNNGGSSGVVMSSRSGDLGRGGMDWSKNIMMTVFILILALLINKYTHVLW
eukprot:TRINITY_DN825_c0_g1_i1.p1 TRINITY_DN825_c0_g1~~TRINITY_DN825_c0_g1_i1.p1  ORF type:complete len:271 (-),score=104.56 TRINITY_DN825_c0_g1_i1:41-853(-)